jgi:hypothetical protein
MRRNSTGLFKGLPGGVSEVRLLKLSAHGKYAKTGSWKTQIKHFNGEMLRLGEWIQTTKENEGTEVAEDLRQGDRKNDVN